MNEKYKQEIEDLEREGSWNLQEDKEFKVCNNPDCITFYEKSCVKYQNHFTYCPECSKELIWNKKTKENKIRNEKLKTLLKTHYKRNQDEIYFINIVFDTIDHSDDMTVLNELKEIEDFQSYIKEKANKHGIELEEKK